MGIELYKNEWLFWKTFWISHPRVLVLVDFDQILSTEHYSIEPALKTNSIKRNYKTNTSLVSA